jgi:hypothetical protein
MVQLLNTTPAKPQEMVVLREDKATLEAPQSQGKRRRREGRKDEDTLELFAV